ncbi:MAG: tetratricopeptide repeat protein [Anaeromyxobacter sp.]
MLHGRAELLARIPELERLLSDEAIRRAVETGDSFKVYGALVRGRGRLAAHQRTVDGLLHNRRAFARPLGAKPSLTTVNGFGTTFLGHGEDAPDGTYITTQCFVALFAIPLIPLGAYVVAKAEGRGWHILAEVPLGLGVRRAAKGAVACAAAAALAIAALAWHAGGRHDVHVVNGLTRPVRVALGSAEATVAPGGHLLLPDVPVGVQPARATAGDEVVDEGPFEVRRGGAVEIWNVAGAAPVYDEAVIYTSEDQPEAAAPSVEPKVHCAERQVEVNADYVFVEPPKTVSMSKHDRQLVKHRVDVGREEGVDGAQLCGWVLESQRRTKDRAAVLEVRARAAGWAQDELTMALLAARELGPEEGVRVARAAMAAHPEDTGLNRVYQNAVLQAGHQAELLAEYRERAEAAPDSASAQYLYVRLLDGEAQWQQVQALRSRFPEDVNLLRVAIGLQWERGEWSGAVACYRKLLATSPVSAAEVLREATEALVASGHGAEALQLLDQAWDKLPPGARAEEAVLYGLVAHRLDAPEADALIRRVEAKEGPAPIQRAQAGFEVSGEDLPAAVGVMAAARRDPGAALGGAAQLRPVETALLDNATWALLYAEALRTNHAEAVQALAVYPRFTPQDEARFRAFLIEGTDPGPALGPTIRAAAALARSRDRSLPAAERARLSARALAEDHLGTTISAAARAWPAI